MPRLAGVDIPENKPIEISLTYIHGIGRATASKILKMLKIDGGMRARDLTEGDMGQIRREIEKTYRVEGDVRREVAQNIKLKMEIGCYQGLRHRKNLPVHGQRTHTNARTRKGPARAIPGKKRAPSPK